MKHATDKTGEIEERSVFAAVLSGSGPTESRSLALFLPILLLLFITTSRHLLSSHAARQNAHTQSDQ